MGITLFVVVILYHLSALVLGVSAFILGWDMKKVVPSEKFSFMFMLLLGVFLFVNGLFGLSTVIKGVML